ncbi:unnamed protein product [Ceutorhynchus assimilis]|uniref:Protein sleepless n=1 Tax=Ceutorhynchus assimilis TaxID=467358 RepID=A0A9N9QJ72_9CUCU|nr:unnamed protein product [Ceutorhynchus assimilis]
MLKITLSAVLILGFSIYEGSALKCWECSSDIDRSCADRFNISTYGFGSDYLYRQSSASGYNQQQPYNPYNQRPYDSRDHSTYRNENSGTTETYRDNNRDPWDNSPIRASDPSRYHNDPYNNRTYDNRDYDRRGGYYNGTDRDGYNNTNYHNRYNNTDYYNRYNNTDYYNRNNLTNSTRDYYDRERGYDPNNRDRDSQYNRNRDYQGRDRDDQGRDRDYQNRDRDYQNSQGRDRNYDQNRDRGYNDQNRDRGYDRGDYNNRGELINNRNREPSNRDPNSRDFDRDRDYNNRDYRDPNSRDPYFDRDRQRDNNRDYNHRDYNSRDGNRDPYYNNRDGYNRDPYNRDSNNRDNYPPPRDYNAQSRSYDPNYQQPRDTSYPRPQAQLGFGQPGPRLVDCNDEEARRTGMRNVCLKKVQRVGEYQLTYIRRCVAIPLEKEIGTCYDPTARGISLDFCEYCEYDGCNSATGLKFNLFLASLVPLVLSWTFLL